jgi:hypothetical protein
MALVKSIHVGVIVHDARTIKTFVQSSKTKLLYDINCWFFDYFRSRDTAIHQLPPLDDWTCSKDDASYWYLALDDGWAVWIRSDIVEF